MIEKDKVKTAVGIFIYYNFYYFANNFIKKSAVMEITMTNLIFQVYL